MTLYDNCDVTMTSEYDVTKGDDTTSRDSSLSMEEIQKIGKEIPQALVYQVD